MMNLLRYKWLILDVPVDKEWILRILSCLTNYGKYIIQPKRSKIALPWPPSPPCTPALHRSFGAIGTFGPCGLGQTKPTAFLATDGLKWLSHQGYCRGTQTTDKYAQKAVTCLTNDEYRTVHMQNIFSLKCSLIALNFRFT